MSEHSSGHGEEQVAPAQPTQSSTSNNNTSTGSTSDPLCDRENAVANLGVIEPHDSRLAFRPRSGDVGHTSFVARQLHLPMRLHSDLTQPRDREASTASEHGARTADESDRDLLNDNLSDDDLHEDDDISSSSSYEDTRERYQHQIRDTHNQDATVDSVNDLLDDESCKDQEMRTPEGERTTPAPLSPQRPAMELGSLEDIPSDNAPLEDEPMLSAEDPDSSPEPNFDYSSHGDAEMASDHEYVVPEPDRDMRDASPNDAPHEDEQMSFAQQPNTALTSDEAGDSGIHADFMDICQIPGFKSRNPLKRWGSDSDLGDAFLESSPTRDLERESRTSHSDEGFDSPVDPEPGMTLPAADAESEFAAPPSGYAAWVNEGRPLCQLCFKKHPPPCNASLSHSDIEFRLRNPEGWERHRKSLRKPRNKRGKAMRKIAGASTDNHGRNQPRHTLAGASTDNHRHHTHSQRPPPRDVAELGLFPGTSFSQSMMSLMNNILEGATQDELHQIQEQFSSQQTSSGTSAVVQTLPITPTASQDSSRILSTRDQEPLAPGLVNTTADDNSRLPISNIASESSAIVRSADGIPARGATTGPTEDFLTGSERALARRQEDRPKLSANSAGKQPRN